MGTLVQYIVIRRDLMSLLNWPLGALVAQGCHAATAAIHTYRTRAETAAYFDQLDRMHKVVLGVTDEAELNALATRLTEAGVEHWLWIEQPENLATALATRPYPKSEVQACFKGLKLLA
ncbi:Peptidyl-tRNA hydrolase II [Fasciola gigantica]|uniref:peptidyl-tRNA hydrolase n=2 Tax=Fasciola TaxID=6191 RepID=A0A4E0R4A6_FASHE|nr:Peptidyl-tRNA hydrolase II [Fasciola hepatica]TPP56106.1 Peptidyl-tRNA hydrolase II [Fasciola gigantica]